MALERKDVRIKLDPEWHAFLSGLAEHDGSDIGEWCEQVILQQLKRRATEATVVNEIAARVGISGNNGDRRG